jgi:hypothetical protein
MLISPSTSRSRGRSDEKIFKLKEDLEEDMYLAEMLRSVEAKVNYELLALFVRERVAAPHWN